MTGAGPAVHTAGVGYLDEGQGPPMLLIMGLASQMLAWDDEFCAMLAARGYWVIRFDNRDIGLSTKFSQSGVPDVAALLVEGEQAVTAFKTFRDSATFTTKRLIVRDAQGLTGKKVEVYSLPYSRIDMWSSENAGTLDMNAEMDLWTRVGHVKVNLRKGIDVRRLDALIAHYVL